MTGYLCALIGHSAALLGPVRGYLDVHSTEWRVRERDAQCDAGASSASCLVFDSPNAIRRVWTYPDNWRTLAPATLEALSWCR